MNLEDFVRLHQNSGYAISKIDKHYFLKRGLVNYSFPPLQTCQLNQKLVNRLKWRSLITVVKTQSAVKNSCEYILKTAEYTVESFPHRTRTTVRKSLKYCEFKRPTLGDLLSEGLRINQQTLKIQGRKDKFLTERTIWNNYATALYNNSDTLILGAYVDGKMIGFAIAYELEGKHYFHIQHIDRDFGTYYPMSGLMYSAVNQFLNRKGTIEISDGIESLTPLPTLNKFKRCMRFERVPITRVYILHPAFALTAKIILFIAIRLFKKRNFQNKFFRQLACIYHGHRLVNRLIELDLHPTLSSNFVLQSDSSK